MFGAISRIAVMAGLSAALLVACGHDVAGTASPPATSSKPPAVDVLTLASI
jgi:ABC-type glycerol-3-phosphate transport system substrate-binding protein